MAFTKINAAGIGTTETVTIDGLSVINNESIGGNLTVTGNATIGGVLTYEDVTNIDSVGLITARQGIEVGAKPGVAASISVDGNMIVSGISTFGGHIDATGDVFIADKIIHAGDTNTTIRFPAADTITAETGGSERARIDSNGKIKLGSGGDVVGAANVELRYDNPVLLVRDTASTSAKTDAKIGFGNESHYPVAFLSHVWDGTNGALTFHTRLSGSETEKVRIAADGKVGVNTTAGAGKLTADASSGYSIIANGDSTGIGLASNGAIVFGTKNVGTYASGVIDATDLSFKTSGTERLDIASDGVITATKSLNIGNTSESFTAATILASTSGISELRLGDTTANAGYIKYSHSTDLLEFATNQTSRVEIASSGKVTFKGGEGSTDAIAVQSEAGGQQLLIGNFRGVTDTGDTGRLGVGKNNNILIFTNASASQIDEFAIGNTDSLPLVLSTANEKRIVISGGGDIGMNVGNPSTRLAIYDADGHNLLLASHNYSGETRLAFSGNQGTGATNVDGATTGQIGVTASAPGGAATGHMSLYTNYGDSLQERARLTAAGQTFFNSGKNTNFSAMAANHKGNISSFESTTGVDSHVAAGDLHHATVYRATSGRTDSLFSFKGSGNCGFFCEVTAYFSAATVGTYQGRQRMYFRASRNGNANFQITQAHNYDKIGTNTTTFFNPLWGSSGSGSNQLLTVKVQTTSMTNYIAIMYVTRFVCMDSIHTFTTLL